MDNSVVLGLVPPHGLSIPCAGWDGHPLPPVSASACPALALTQDLWCGGFPAAAPLCLWQPILSKAFAEALSFWQTLSPIGVCAEVMHRLLGTSLFLSLSCAAPWWPRPGTRGTGITAAVQVQLGTVLTTTATLPTITFCLLQPLLPSHLVGWIKQIHPGGTSDATEEITQTSFPSVMKCALG